MKPVGRATMLASALVAMSVLAKPTNAFNDDAVNDAQVLFDGRERPTAVHKLGRNSAVRRT
jgi:hypothetical protein